MQHFGAGQARRRALRRRGKPYKNFISSKVLMDVSPDFADLLKILNKHKVRYLIIGAYAAIYYTEPRYTKDLDIWVDSSLENAQKVYSALGDFGAPLKSVTPEDFTSHTLFYQIGVAPIRVDIIAGLKGLEFKSAWKRRKRAKYGKIPINIIGIDDLIASKEASGRDGDLRDVEKLKRARRSRKRG